MKPRYASSVNTAPAHLAELIRHARDRGLLIFRINDEDTVRIPFDSNAALHQLLQKLIDEKVPLSVGGHIDGPCEEVCSLIDAGILHGTPIQLSWRAPQQWTLRELTAKAMEWKETLDPTEIANCSFDPTSLQHKQMKMPSI
ncbi:hypothetical protein [Undibacterium sp. Di24W]|uniref:hypothetical protein n=1 Tax=Undibacterium sp. Di24W TaxID=3413033 RepID=UPI003BF090A4